MAAVHWYVARNGHKVGPFSAAELRQLAAFQLLQRGEMLWTEGLTRWVEASSLAWLFPAGGQKRYWLHIGGKTRGPYAAEQIRAALAARQITLDTQACPEDAKTWTPLRQVSEFRAYNPPSSVSASQARLLAGSLDADEAELYLASKGGDALARLITTLLDLKKAHASNPTLAESLDKSIEVLRARRAEASKAPE
jgi:GYF domain 2